MSMITTTTRPLPDEQIKTLANELLELERQIAELQGAKSTIYKAAKGNFGAGMAAGLKTAVGLLRLEPEVRVQRLAAGEYALAILKIVEDVTTEAPVHANANTPEPGFEGWRKQRDLERSKPFTPTHEVQPDHEVMRDPDTGGILEPAAFAPFREALGELGVTLSDLEIPNAA